MVSHLVLPRGRLPPDLTLCLALQSVWVRRGALRWWRDWRPQRWVDVGVALEQSTGSDGRRDSILFVYYTQYDEKKVGSSHAQERTSYSVQTRTVIDVLSSFSTFRCF